MKSLILRISYLGRIFLSSLGGRQREKKENARRTISSTKRVSEGAFVLTVRPSVWPSVCPRVERNPRWLARSSRIERARTMIIAWTASRAFSPRHRRFRCLAREHEGRNLAVPNPILRAPHDVADVLYYRLTKVMWRRLAAGAQQS